MSVDLYQLCPCGLGKKLKFCCKDVAHDLDSIVRKIEGGQLKAAEAEIDKRLADSPDRACFLALKADVLLERMDLDAMRNLSERFLQAAPDNPVALACSAVSAARVAMMTDNDDGMSTPGVISPGCRRAVDLLQDSLAASDPVLPQLTYFAIAVVADCLLSEGLFVAAREHFAFQYLLDQENGHHPYQRLLSISKSQSIDLLLRQDQTIPPAPEDVPWHDDFTSAIRLASRGLWRQSAEAFEALAKRHDAPLIHRALSVTYCRLAETEKAVASLRKFARYKETPRDDAVEAEALAQLLDPASKATKSQFIAVTQPVKDAEQLLTALQASPLALAEPPNSELMMPPDENSPPPKAAFSIWDREFTDEVFDDFKKLPLYVCHLQLLGKETDKPARIRVAAMRDELPGIQELVEEMLGSEFEEEADEETIAEVYLDPSAFRKRMRMTSKASREQRRKMYLDCREEHLREEWAESPLDVLGGKTPNEVAGDPEWELPLAAAILVIESRDATDLFDICDRLRDKLKIECPGPIDPSIVDPSRLPMIRIHRIDPTSLKDDDLMMCFAFASQLNHIPAIERLAPELLRRESLRDKVDSAELWGKLAMNESDPDQMLERIHNAQMAAIKSGRSPAKWKVKEVSVRVLRNESEETQALLTDLQLNHLNEPGVRDQLQKELESLGFRTEPTPVGPTAGKPSGNPRPSQPSIITSADAPADASANAPADASQAEAAGSPKPQESKIWLPGD